MKVLEMKELAAVLFIAGLLVTGVSCKKPCDPKTAKPGDECYVEQPQPDPYAAAKEACAAKHHPDSTYTWNPATNHCDATFTGQPLEQRDTVLYFWQGSGLKVIKDTTSLKSIATNPEIRYIYLSPQDDDVWTYNAEAWPIIIDRVLKPAINTSPKVTGKGNIVTWVPDMMSATDSLWLVANGWTVNKH